MHALPVLQELSFFSTFDALSKALTDFITYSVAVLARDAFSGSTKFCDSRSSSQVSVPDISFVKIPGNFVYIV